VTRTYIYTYTHTYNRYYEAVRAEEAAKVKAMEEEAAQRRKEDDMRKLAGEDEDHDNRKLKFEDRFRMAENNRKEGDELFEHGNFAHAAERYSEI
jgi:hypothetical protein